MRAVLLTWRALPLALRVVKRAVKPARWETAREHIVGLKLAAAFDAVFACAARHRATATFAARRNILQLRALLRAWFRRVPALHERALEMEHMRLEAHLHCRCTMLRSFVAVARQRYVLRACATALTRSHSQRVRAAALVAWWPGCHAADAAAALRAAAAVAGRVRYAVRRWRSHGSLWQHTRDASILAHAYASTVCARRLGLRRWRYFTHAHTTSAAVLSQRARIVQLASCIAAAVRRWRWVLKERRWARRPRLAFGWIAWRRGRRRRLATVAVRARANTRSVARAYATWRRMASRRDHDLWRRRCTSVAAVLAAVAGRQMKLAIARWRYEHGHSGYILLATSAFSFGLWQRATSKTFRRWHEQAGIWRVSRIRLGRAAGRGDVFSEMAAMQRWKLHLRLLRSARAAVNADGDGNSGSAIEHRERSPMARAVSTWQPGHIVHRKAQHAAPLRNASPMLYAAAEAGRLRAKRARNSATHRGHHGASMRVENEDAHKGTTSWAAPLKARGGGGQQGAAAATPSSTRAYKVVQADSWCVQPKSRPVAPSRAPPQPLAPVDADELNQPYSGHRRQQALQGTSRRPSATTGKWASSSSMRVQPAW